MYTHISNDNEISTYLLDGPWDTFLSKLIDCKVFYEAKIFENHLNPVMLVFIGVHMNQGFSRFPVFCIILFWSD